MGTFNERLVLVLPPTVCCTASTVGRALGQSFVSIESCTFQLFTPPPPMESCLLTQPRPTATARGLKAATAPTAAAHHGAHHHISGPPLDAIRPRLQWSRRALLALRLKSNSSSTFAAVGSLPAACRPWNSTSDVSSQLQIVQIPEPCAPIMCLPSSRWALRKIIVVCFTKAKLLAPVAPRQKRAGTSHSIWSDRLFHCPCLIPDKRSLFWVRGT